MLLRVYKAAQLAGVTRQAIYKAIREGRLHPVSDMPVTCFTEEEVTRYRDMRNALSCQVTTKRVVPIPSHLGTPAHEPEKQDKDTDTDDNWDKYL